MKVAVGVFYKGKDVTQVGIYDIEKDDFSVITTQEAKKLYKGNRLRCTNADFQFFVTQVNFLIGEQNNYPHIFYNKDIPILEDGVLIYDIKKEEAGYHTLVIHNNAFKNCILNDSKLLELKKAGYKANFEDDNGKVKILYKDVEGNVKEIEDNDVVLKPFLEKWYKLDDSLAMIKVSECNVKQFQAEGIRTIDGFAGSDIEEVDLTGARVIAARAFEGCKKLRKVILSNSLEQISMRAFADCTQLKELHIPESVLHIGQRIYTKGTVYLQRRYEDAITPFTREVKIVMVGEEKTKDEVKCLYNRGGKLYCLTYNLQQDNGKPITVNRAIKQSDIDIMENYINYKDGKVLDGKGAIIICRNGAEYIFLDTNDYKLKQEPLEYFSNIKLIDGIIAGDEILPLQKEWGWFFVNGIAENKTTSRIAGQIANTADSGNVLTDEQKLVISDYITEQCISKLGNFTITNAKLDARCKEEQAKYPGYTWKFRTVVSGGLAGSDNPKKYDKNGQPILRDVNGNYFCYFGHANTSNHWVVDGYKDGKIMKTFTFGGDCCQHFTGMSDEDMQRIMEYDNKMSKAVKEITTVIKNNALKQYTEDFNLFYTIALSLKNKNMTGLLGDTGKFINRCIDLKMPIPKVMMEDVYDELTKGSWDKNKVYCEDILTQVVKDPKKLSIIYNNDDLYEAEQQGKDARKFSQISKEIDNYCCNYLYQPGGTLKTINDIVDKVIVDQEVIKKADQIRAKFLKLGLDRGFYLLNERYIVDTRKALISDRYEEGVLCNLSHELEDKDFNIINQLDKKDYRPIGSTRTIRSESGMYRGAQILNGMLDVGNIPEGEYRYVINLPSMVPKAIWAFAWRGNLLAYFTRNLSKPVYLIKDNKINFDGRYGIFENCLGMYSEGRCYPYIAEEQTSSGKLSFNTILSSKAMPGDQIFNYKNEYKIGKGSLKTIITRDLAKFKADENMVEEGTSTFKSLGLQQAFENFINSTEYAYGLKQKQNYLAIGERFIIYKGGNDKAFYCKRLYTNGLRPLKAYETKNGKVITDDSYIKDNNIHTFGDKFYVSRYDKWEVYDLDGKSNDIDKILLYLDIIEDRLFRNVTAAIYKDDYLWKKVNGDIYYNNTLLFSEESHIIHNKELEAMDPNLFDINGFAPATKGYWKEDLHNLKECKEFVVKAVESNKKFEEEEAKRKELKDKIQKVLDVEDKLEEIFKEAKSIKNALVQYHNWKDNTFDNYIQILIKASDKLDEYNKTGKQVSISNEAEHPLKKKLAENLATLSQWDKDDPKYHDLHKNLCEKYLSGEMLSAKQYNIVKKVFEYLKNV